MECKIVQSLKNVLASVCVRVCVCGGAIDIWTVIVHFEHKVSHLGDMSSILGKVRIWVSFFLSFFVKQIQPGHTTATDLGKRLLML